MRCNRCDLDLPRGAAHVSEAGCIDALKERLEKAATCAACGEAVPTVIHPGCVPAELVNRGAKLGSSVVEDRFKAWLAAKLAGQPAPGQHEDDPDDMDRDQRRAARGHRQGPGHFEP